MSNTGDISFPCDNIEPIVGEDGRDKKLLVYTLFYNWTLFYRSPLLSSGAGVHYQTDWFLSKMKLSLDNGIIDYYAKTPSERAIPLT